MWDFLDTGKTSFIFRQSQKYTIRTFRLHIFNLAATKTLVYPVHCRHLLYYGCVLYKIFYIIILFKRILVGVASFTARSSKAALWPHIATHFDVLFYLFTVRNAWSLLFLFPSSSSHLQLSQICHVTIVQTFYPFCSLLSLKYIYI